MRPWVKALNSTVDTIRKLAERRGVVIGEAAMAEKMDMTETEFRACLSGEAKVPKKLMTELWPAYEYLLKEQLRADKVNRLKARMESVYRRAAKEGMEITDHEIARRIGITPDVLSGYLDGSIEVPEGLPEAIFEAFRNDLYKNVRVESVTMHSVKYIEPLDLADEDEL